MVTFWLNDDSASLSSRTLATSCASVTSIVGKGLTACAAAGTKDEPLHNTTSKIVMMLNIPLPSEHRGNCDHFASDYHYLVLAVEDVDSEKLTETNGNHEIDVGL